MKWANPLYSPISVFLGCAVLGLGVRLLRAPNAVVIPLSVATATLSASLRTSKSSTAQGSLASDSAALNNPVLVQELAGIQQQAQTLARKAQLVEAEAQQQLKDSNLVELLGTVQYACERTRELPTKIDRLAQRLQGDDSILAVSDLQRQLGDVQNKLTMSSGVAQTQLLKLADSLQANIQLALQGQDARQAQVTSLSTLILEAARVLQTLQNQLRTLDLQDTARTNELQSLSNELKDFHETLDLLVLR